jgi:hypothetical protein
VKTVTTTSAGLVARRNASCKCSPSTSRGGSPSRGRCAPRRRRSGDPLRCRTSTEPGFAPNERISIPIPRGVALAEKLTEATTCAPILIDAVLAPAIAGLQMPSNASNRRATRTMPLGHCQRRADSKPGEMTRKGRPGSLPSDNSLTSKRRRPGDSVASWRRLLDARAKNSARRSRHGSVSIRGP